MLASLVVVAGRRRIYVPASGIQRRAILSLSVPRLEDWNGLALLFCPATLNDLEGQTSRSNKVGGVRIHCSIPKREHLEMHAGFQPRNLNITSRLESENLAPSAQRLFSCVEVES